jgi:hypothetical protein
MARLAPPFESQDEISLGIVDQLRVRLAGADKDALVGG